MAWGKALHLFRAFFPSWKFFEDISVKPELWVRTSKKGHEYSDWEPLLKKIPRSPVDFLYAPAPNLMHAYSSHLYHLVADMNDVTDDQDFSQSVSYRMTVNLVCYELKRRGLLTESIQFQFKVISDSSEELLRSVTHGF